MDWSDSLNQKRSLKLVLLIIGCFLTVIVTMLALIPFLSELLVVEVSEQMPPMVTQAAVPEAPEKVSVTVYYVMPENSKKISEIYIEVFRSGSSEVSYVRVPADTKITLSEELFKSLQTYAPELPQHLKISNMAENFSTEYGLTGCNRILSEVLGISFKEYVRTDATAMAEWKNLQEEEKSGTAFFDGYAKWLENSGSSRTTEERWMFYENRLAVSTVSMEIAPGSQEKDGYLLSAKRSKERLEQLMWKTESAEQ